MRTHLIFETLYVDRDLALSAGNIRRFAALHAAPRGHRTPAGEARDYGTNDRTRRILVLAALPTA
jgi:hypothetical protein